jgi:hypothetical protein
MGGLVARRPVPVESGITSAIETTVIVGAGRVGVAIVESFLTFIDI